MDHCRSRLKLDLRVLQYSDVKLMGAPEITEMKVNRQKQVLEKQCHFTWAYQSRWEQGHHWGQGVLLPESTLSQSRTRATLPRACWIHSPQRKPTLWSHATGLVGQVVPWTFPACPHGFPNYHPNDPNATVRQDLPSISQEIIFSQISSPQSSEKWGEVLKVLLEDRSLTIHTGMFTTQKNSVLLKVENRSQNPGYAELKISAIFPELGDKRHGGRKWPSHPPYHSCC